MTEASRHDAWQAGDRYEAYMGRWSRQVAPRFLDWLALPEGLDWLDAGCGTGALSAAILARCNPQSLLALDPSQDFAAAARATLADPRADVRVGSVLGLGPARRSFDLLLFDAHYGTGAGSVALDKLNRLGWIGPDSWISVETGERESVDVAGFEIDAERRVGKAKLTLLRPE